MVSVKKSLAACVLILAYLYRWEITCIFLVMSVGAFIVCALNDRLEWTMDLGRLSVIVFEWLVWFNNIRDPKPPAWRNQPPPPEKSNTDANGRITAASDGVSEDEEGSTEKMEKVGMQNAVKKLAEDNDVKDMVEKLVDAKKKGPRNAEKGEGMDTEWYNRMVSKIARAIVDERGDICIEGLVCPKETLGAMTTVDHANGIHMRNEDRGQDIDILVFRKNDDDSLHRGHGLPAVIGPGFYEWWIEGLKIRSHVYEGPGAPKYEWWIKGDPDPLARLRL
jgi:hypothetical protein